MTAMLVVVDEKFGGEFLFMATVKGTVKKTPVEDFKNVRKSGLIAIKLKEDDCLSWVKQTSEGDHIMMVTREGKCIQFDQSDARPMGRASQGVRGIKLRTGDEVVEMDAVKDMTSDLLVVMENGLGKRTPLEEYRFQGRGGSGVKTANLSEKTGKVVGAKVIEPGTEGDIMIVSKKGVMIRSGLENVPSRGRATQGVYLMRVKGDDKVASMSFIEKTDEIESSGEEVTEEEAQTSLV